MNAFDLLYVINIACIFISAKVAADCFNDGNPKVAWANVAASAFNLALVINHFIL